MSPLALREEQRQKVVQVDYHLFVIDHTVLSKIFERQRDEVIGYWRKLHNEEL